MVSFNISFVGTGRVAESLCRIIHQKGHKILQVTSSSRDKGLPMSEKYGARYTSEPLFSGDTDIILVAVPDHRLKEVISRIRCSENSIVAHTAGSYGIDLFPENIRKPAVFYPLQTFSTGRETMLKGVPVLIETAELESADRLTELARSIECNVYYSDLEHRKLLHVAAVFVSNFVNHMLTSGKEISARAGFSFDILKPLFLETVGKALENSPERSQTGPAVRNDLNTIKNHRELLSFSPDLERVYEEVTSSIMRYYNIKSSNE